MTTGKTIALTRWTFVAKVMTLLFNVLSSWKKHKLKSRLLGEISITSDMERTPVMAESKFSSVAQSCLTLCDPMNCSTPGLPVHHQLPEFTQNHVHRVGDAIQPFHPLLSLSPCPQSLPASESFPMSQLFARGGQSTGASALASFLPKKSQG